MGRRHLIIFGGLLGSSAFAGCGTPFANTTSARHPAVPSQMRIRARSSQAPSSSSRVTPSSAAPSTSPQSARSVMPKSSTTTGPAFLLVFPPHILASVWGGGLGGNSAPLGTIHSNALGFITPPSQPHWFYTIQYHKDMTSIVNTSRGFRVNIMQNTPYKIFGGDSAQPHRLLTVGNSGSSGDISLPSCPGKYLSIDYVVHHVRKAVVVYEPRNRQYGTAMPS